MFVKANIGDAVGSCARESLSLFGPYDKLA